MSPEKKPTKPVDIYVRVSRVGKREGQSFQSPKQQEERCRAQLKADGLKAGQVFVDLDESGAKASRPAFDEALARVKAGESGGVIVYDLSRFGRSTRNVLDGIDFIEAYDATFISCAEKFDTSTASGRFVLTLFAALREMEREQAKERWAVSRAKAKARGVHLALAPAGFHRNGGGELVEMPKHIEAVKKVYSTRARGGSWNEAARALEEGGVPTNRGNTSWSRQAVYNLVRNPIYKERRVVPAWQWQKAQPRHDGKRGPRGEGYVLGGGIVRCGLCGSGMIRSSASGKGLLRCPGKGMGHACVNYDIASDYLLSLVFSHIGPQLREREGGEELYAAVERAREAYRAACEILEVETLPEESAQARALNEAEAALSEFEAARDLPLGLGDVLTPVGVRQEFEKLPVAEQRHVLRQVVSRAVVRPGRGLHIGQRIEVEFHDGSYWPASATPDWTPPKVEGPVWTTKDLARHIKEKQAAQ